MTTDNAKTDFPGGNRTHAEAVSWAHVGAQLKRRHDLVSALVDTITAQDHYEGRSLDEVRAA
jgi:hypothetical protein